jgi:hypothetical protein
MPPELERKLYYDGITLFNEHEFFEAHEVWEDIWHMAYGLKHSFYQGLIQCSVALEHYRRSNPRGVLSLYKSYTRSLLTSADVHGAGRAIVPGGHGGGPAARAEGRPVPQRGEIELDPSQAPKIALLYDPFETGEASAMPRLKSFESYLR